MAAARYAFGNTGMIHQVQGIPNQPVIPAVIKAYHGLDAAITNVLKLLIKRAIHVGFNSAQPGSPPTNIKYFLK
jgi:hypothetical protein